MTAIMAGRPSNIRCAAKLSKPRSAAQQQKFVEKEMKLVECHRTLPKRIFVDWTDGFSCS